MYMYMNNHQHHSAAAMTSSQVQNTQRSKRQGPVCIRARPHEATHALEFRPLIESRKQPKNSNVGNWGRREGGGVKRLSRM